MKKLQLFFAVAAILASALGVYANKAMFTTYYQESSSTAFNCTTTIALPGNCTDSGGTRCTESIPGDPPTTVYISKFAMVDQKLECVRVNRTP